MAAVAIDENVIKSTTETLGKVIKQVPLTEKLLSRPPFKFIHDIIKEVIRNNGFLTGLYTDDELSSENIKNKEAKIEFLQKTIDAIGFITNAPLSHIKANKIVAGLEPERTNELLQALGKCVISRKSHEVAVKKVLNGEKPGASNSILSADDVVANESPKEKKSSAPKASAVEQKKPVPSKTTTSNKPTSTNANKSTPKSSTISQTKPKTPIKSTSTAAKKPVTPATKTTPKAATNISTARSSQQTKVSNSRTTVQKNPATATSPAVKRGQEKIAKPVTKPATNKPASKANLVNQAANGRTATDRVEANESKSAIVRSRTLTKEELNAVQTNKQANRAEAENKAAAANLSETNLEANSATNLNDDDVGGHEEEAADERIGKNVDTINEPVSLGLADPSASSESIADADLRIRNQRSDQEENDEVEQRQRNGEEMTPRTSENQPAVAKQKSARPKADQTIKQAEKVETSNEIPSRSARRPVVSSVQADRQSQNRNQTDKQTNGTINQRGSNEESAKVTRPTTASRPLTARAAPPRAVSRRALREEKQTNNVLEMASLARPQTSVKQVLVTNLIKESNDAGDSLDDDEDDLEASLDKEQVNRRGLTATTEHSLLKDNIRKLDEQADDFLTARNQSFNRELVDDDPEKGSLVKKLIKSKMDLEGEHQVQPSSATLVRSNRDIERLKEHIQTLSKLANPLSKLLDNLQEDIDLMLLEERNWLDEQQRNEQQLLALREQMDEELKSVSSQIATLDDQIDQEKDAILVTNVNLLINQAKLENIVRKMIEN